MAYAAGSVAVQAGLVPQQIRALVEAQMTSAGWVFVEEYLNWRVWKCPATLNGVADFYVLMYATTGFAIGQCEVYDSALHRFQRGMYTYVYNQVVPAAQWDPTTQAPQGQTWGTVVDSSSLTYMQVSNRYTVFPTVSFDYVVQVTAKSCFFSVTWPGANAGAAVGRWIGLFDTLLANPADDPMPFGMFDPWSASTLSTQPAQSYFGATSRMPLPFADSVWQAANSAYGGLALSAAGASFAQQAGSNQFNGLGGGMDAWGAPAQIGPKYFMQRANHISDGRSLVLRGRIVGMVTAGSGTGLYLGDEFAFAGKTWVVVAYGDRSVALAIDKAAT